MSSWIAVRGTGSRRACRRGRSRRGRSGGRRRSSCSRAGCRRTRTSAAAGPVGPGAVGERLVDHAVLDDLALGGVRDQQPPAVGRDAHVVGAVAVHLLLGHDAAALAGGRLGEVDPHHVGQAGPRDREVAAVAGGEDVVDVLVVPLPDALLHREVERQPVRGRRGSCCSSCSRSGTMLMRSSFRCVRASTIVAVPSQLLPTTITVRLPVGARRSVDTSVVSGSAGAAGAAARRPAEATAVTVSAASTVVGRRMGLCLLAARTPGPASVVFLGSFNAGLGRPVRRIEAIVPRRVVSRLVSPGSSVPGSGPQLPGASGGPAPAHVRRAGRKFSSDLGRGVIWRSNCRCRHLGSMHDDDPDPALPGGGGAGAGAGSGGGVERGRRGPRAGRNRRAGLGRGSASGSGPGGSARAARRGALGRPAPRRSRRHRPGLHRSRAPRRQ